MGFSFSSSSDSSDFDEPQLSASGRENLQSNCSPTPVAAAAAAASTKSSSIKCKCGWSHVVKRQTSPPNATQLMIKLFLASGKIAIFQVDDLATLIRLLKDVKARMEYYEEQQKQQQLQMQRQRQQQQNQVLSSSNRQEQQQRPVSKSIFPFKMIKPIHSTNAEEEVKDVDDRNNHNNTPSSIWEQQLWLGLCLVLSLVAFILAGMVIYLLLVGNTSDGEDDADLRMGLFNTNIPVTDLTGCQDTDIGCPPDYGWESRYKIKAVHYVWSTSIVQIEYVISDYILDNSVDSVIQISTDTTDCGNTDGVPPTPSQATPLQEYNSWLNIELINPSILDAGANLYNEGKGKRQFELHLKLLPNSNITDAPFFQPAVAEESATGLDGTVYVCATFLIKYNSYDEVNGYQGNVVVNYVEDLLQLDIVSPNGNSSSAPYIRNVQKTTITPPPNINDLDIDVNVVFPDDYNDGVDNDGSINDQRPPEDPLLCSALCATLRCCFEDGLDCESLFPDEVNCDDYAPCASIYKINDDNENNDPEESTGVTTFEIPAIDALNPTAVQSTCNNVDTYGECFHHCTPVRCCAPPLGQDGCYFAGQEDPSLLEIDCLVYEACNILYEVPSPELVASACTGDNVASCAAVCRPVICCFSPSYRCGLQATTVAINCDEYWPCREFFDIAGSYDVVESVALGFGSGGTTGGTISLTRPLILPDPDSVLITCPS